MHYSRGLQYFLIQKTTLLLENSIALDLLNRLYGLHISLPSLIERREYEEEKKDKFDSLIAQLLFQFLYKFHTSCSISLAVLFASEKEEL